MRNDGCTLKDTPEVVQKLGRPNRVRVSNESLPTSFVITSP
jgi:hypothetical protein